ncbi:hypothetical protein E3N88_28982 [Mikania micrantha]|uniref:Uncharacterized protein n=1 Tax=Mikania micrantha TaxID=192012 RepID=A0A5N6N1K7_9ASTR|nr:hypothetical protein E3N88_28982 [Mikania micrantha]
MGADLGLSLIQVIRDMDANPHSPVREVELIGTSETIAKTERQIKEVLAKFVPAKSATMDEKLDDRASLISRVEVLEYKCDELRHDIEQMCMQMLNLITVYTALEEEVEALRKYVINRACLRRRGRHPHIPVCRSSWGSNEYSNEFCECLHFFTLVILKKARGILKKAKMMLWMARSTKRSLKMETRGAASPEFPTRDAENSYFVEERVQKEQENNGGHAASALMACIAPKAKQHNEHTITAATIGCAQRIVDASLAFSHSCSF